MSSSTTSLSRFIQRENCMNRLMQWFCDEEVSTVVKVGVVALAVISLMGAGFLLGHPILIPSLAMGPLGLWAVSELDVISENERILIAYLGTSPNCWGICSQKPMQLQDEFDIPRPLRLCEF